MFGAAGFVGSNLAFHLEKTGKYECRLYDITDSKLNLRYDNIPFNYKSCDISKNVTELNEHIQDADIVIDLVAHVHPSHFLRAPLDIVDRNLFDCLKVVDACVKNEKWLIHFSTSEVYGKTGGSSEPFREDETDCILGPISNHRWIYSCSKQLLDRIIHAHGMLHGLEYTLLRPFNFVGPLMDYLIRDWRPEDTPRMLANFASALIYGRPLKLVDGGHSRRCFTFIDDAIEAIELILDHPKEMSQQIVNIGNPANETTIRDVAYLMRDIYRKHCDETANNPIVDVTAEDFYGPGYEDCDRRLPDITKLKNIGWAPKHDLEQTFMKSMVYFYRNKERLVEVLGD